MKLPGEPTLDSTLPPRASRAPTMHMSPRRHEAHFLSWPGYGHYVPRTKHYFKAEVDSRSEARGELPPTARMLESAGSRPYMPIFCTTAYH